MRTLSRIYTLTTALIWSALLILLPVTSMPAVRDLLHINTIAGPSVLALGILIILWLVPYLIKNRKLPREIVPLLGFILVCLLSISAAWFLNIPTFKDAGLIRPMASAFITLLVGAGYFLITYSRIATEKDFRVALQWIYLGGVIMIFWSLLQSTMWLANGRYPGWMRDMQDFFSLGPLYRQRTTGFALEPSWLAHMLNMLYLPMWLSAAFGGYSVFAFRLFRKITVEMGLLVLGILLLMLTLSRVGWITFFCMAAYLVIRLNIRLVRWVQSRFGVKLDRKVVSTIFISSVLVLFYFGLAALAAYGMSRVDPRMADLFMPEFWQLKDMNRYANALQFGERVVYWQAGWEVFNRYPIFGVGLGNAGRWFPQTIPAYGMNLIEVRQLIYRSGDLPNIQNLWIRILAETGIVGFAFFSAWLLSLLKKATSYCSSVITMNKMAGYWGIFIIIGIILEGFSIDSFAMPFFWISAGFVLSSGRIIGKPYN